MSVPQIRPASACPMWALATLLAACGEPSSLVRIIDHVAPGAQLGLRDVELVTIRDIETARGDLLQVWGGATIAIDPALEPLDGGLSRDTFVRGATPVRLDWIMDGDVVVPSDFDSLIVLTAFAHFESAALHFSALGAAAAAEAIPIYYDPVVDEAEGAAYPESDNAAFFPEADGFVILPMRMFQKIPFAANPGVVTHEVAHRIWYYELWGGQLFAALELYRETPGSLATWNRIRATDEGVADFFAAALTGAPDFLAASTPSEISVPRDLSITRVLEPNWVAGDEPVTDEGEYDRYLPGSVVASALWKVGDVATIEAVEMAVLAAMRELSAQVTGQVRYQFGELEAAVIRHLPPSARAPACAAVRTPYDAVWSAFSAACP